MKLDFLKDKKEFISVVLLWISAFLGVVIVVKVTGFFAASARAGQLVENAVAQGKPDPNDMEKYFAGYREIAEELKKKNLFAPPPPKEHPAKQVSGILGDEVLINGKWYKVGDKVGDAKIVKIEPTKVTIEWEGKEKVFCPFDVKSAPEPRKKGKRPVEKKGRPEKVEAQEKPAEEKVAAAPAEEDPLAWMGVKLSAKVRARLLEQWNKMSDEQKEQWKEQWNKMSDDQKQQAVDSMEEHM